MSAQTLLQHLAAAGVTVTANGDRLRAKGPPGAVTPALRQLLTDHKASLLVALHLARIASGEGMPADLVPSLPDPELHQAADQLAALPDTDRERVATWYTRQLAEDHQRHPESCKAACPWCKESRRRNAQPAPSEPES